MSVARVFKYASVKIHIIWKIGLVSFILIAAKATYADGTFAACVNNLKIQAQVAGISDKTIAQVLNKARHLPRVIELDRQQPEFTQTFANYFITRINDERIQRGRELLAKHHSLLDQIQRDNTGVTLNLVQ